MINQITTLRKNIDSLAAAVQTFTKSRETSLSFTHMQEARMLLGRCLGELGEATPYPQSKNPADTTIEPEADKGTVFHFGDNVEYLSRIKAVRANVTKQCDEIKKIFDAANLSHLKNTYLFVYLSQALGSLDLSGMWLGMELGRIRDAK